MVDCPSPEPLPLAKTPSAASFRCRSGPTTAAHGRDRAPRPSRGCSMTRSGPDAALGRGLGEDPARGRPSRPRGRQSLGSVLSGRRPTPRPATRSGGEGRRHAEGRRPVSPPTVAATASPAPHRLPPVHAPRERRRLLRGDGQRRQVEGLGQSRTGHAELRSNRHVARLVDEAAKAVVVGLLAASFAHPGIMPLDDRGASPARAW